MYRDKKKKEAFEKALKEREDRKQKFMQKREKTLKEQAKLRKRRIKKEKALKQIDQRPVKVQRWTHQFCEAKKIGDEPKLNRKGFWEQKDHNELDRKYKLLTGQV